MTKNTRTLTIILTVQSKGGKFGCNVCSVYVVHHH